MYRFYCTECKKVKRVQRIPFIIDNARADKPADRVGQCNRHRASNNMRDYRTVTVKRGR